MAWEATVAEMVAWAVTACSPESHRGKSEDSCARAARCGLGRQHSHHLACMGTRPMLCTRTHPSRSRRRCSRRGRELACVEVAEEEQAVEATAAAEAAARAAGRMEVAAVGATVAMAMASAAAAEALGEAEVAGQRAVAQPEADGKESEAALVLLGVTKQREAQHRWYHVGV